MRDRPDRPEGFGVQPLQGAFTLWNQQADPAVTVGADLSGLRAGRPGAPVRDSGVFGGIVKNLGRYAASWIAGWPNRPSSTAALT